MPTPASFHPPVAPSSGGRGHYSPAEILFGIGTAAVVLLLGLVVWRLLHLAHPHASAAKEVHARHAETQSAEPAPPPVSLLPVIVVDGTTQLEETVPAAPPSIPSSGEEQPQPGPVLKAPAVPRPRLAKRWRADAIVEERLGKTETALRHELVALPEVRCLSDREVGELRTSQRCLLDPLFARRHAAGAQLQEADLMLKAARINLRAARVNLGVNRRDSEAIECERCADLAETGANAAFAKARAAFQQAENAWRQNTAKNRPEQQRIHFQINQRLHETMTQRAVHAGLVLASGPDCKLAPTTAVEMAELSLDLRRKGLVAVPTSPIPGLSSPRRGRQKANLPNPNDAKQEREKALQKWCDHRRLEDMSGTVPTLTQMLQIEDEAARLQLVRVLTRISSPSATTELAVRAIVDLSPAVRQAALEELENRPESQYAPVLLRGLRYPWPPVADHAAYALRKLDCRSTVAGLVKLLDLPSPSAPVLNAQTKRVAVREVVRVNHMRSCLLCHEPSENAEDGLVRGRVPTPGEPLPPAYYAEVPIGDFVRADITYLRQDFSVVLNEKEAAPWPNEQRYDFVVRLRPLSLPPLEMVTTRDAASQYSQREAALYALRGLTGLDGGDSSAKWRELLGIARKDGDDLRGIALDDREAREKNPEHLR